jgi:uncharacterized protein YlzI (FlbEa/FlbD family)
MFLKLIEDYINVNNIDYYGIETMKNGGMAVIIFFSGSLKSIVVRESISSLSEKIRSVTNEKMKDYKKILPHCILMECK